MVALSSLLLLAGSWGLAQAQNYVGTPIKNSLPGVPGAEITYFKIHNTKSGYNATTLTNYINLNSSNQRLVPSEIRRAVVFIHGLQRDAGTYMANMLSALAQVQGHPDVNTNSVAILCPYFPNGDDKNYGYPWTSGLPPGQGSTSNALVWSASNWASGGNDQYPYTDRFVSSYDVLDQIVTWFDNRTIFPNVREIVVGGHSLGAQMVQRYAAVGKLTNTHSRLTHWIANPDSLLWFNSSRPLDTSGCPTYDDWREGLSNYNNTYGETLVGSGDAAVLANYNSKNTVQARGILDLGDDSSTCAPFTTGANRNERFFNFINWFQPTCSNPTGSACSLVDYVDEGHDAGAMMASSAGQARLFLDNFNGTLTRSYDFGCPRLQKGDDPYPNPSCTLPIPQHDTGTYAGGMKYVGCWSDTEPHVLSYTAYAGNSSNTIEGCTAACVAKGYTLAGAEYGTECYCGNSLSYQAFHTVDEGCQVNCSGNANEICGDANRISLFSTNGAPTKNKAPGEPPSVGNYNFVGCYTDNEVGRALTGKSESNSNMTVENCAAFCSGYSIFGVEYGAECYCGNQIVGSNVPAGNGNCSMSCAGNALEFCGNGNYLDVYATSGTLNGSTSTTSTSSTSKSTTATTSPTMSSSSSTISSINKSTNTTTFVSSTSSSTSTNSTSKSATTSTSSSTFGSTTSTTSKSTTTPTSSLTSSSTTTSATSSSSPSTLTTSTSSGSGPSSSSSSSSSSNSGSSSSSSKSTTITTTTASSSPSSPTSSTRSTSTTSTSSSASPSVTISCPASNGTDYTTPSGNVFVVECNTDHQAGDLSMVYVKSLQQCIDTCGSTPKCVDVSLSGTACYLKQFVGKALTAAGINGGRLISSTTAAPSATATGARTRRSRIFMA